MYGRRYTGFMTCHRLHVAIVGLILVGCAGGPDPLRTPTPAEVPALESAFEADPADVDLGLLLSAAYREAGRTDDAFDLIEGLRADFPDDPGLTVVAGLLNEDAGRYGQARVLYEDFLSETPSGPLSEEVERRLDLVWQEALREEVRSALEREAELAQTTPDPAAVGIFPFLYEGTAPAWEPLSLALAELLTTDLAITGRLTVLERVKVQTLVDELSLAEAGFVEAETAARSGRLLGSGHIVQGSYRIEDGARIGIDVAVVEVGPPGSVTVDPVRAEDAIERLFDLEKQLALDFYEEIGIELTPAERERINERHTESVQALLVFGHPSRSPVLVRADDDRSRSRTGLLPSDYRLEHSGF
mgnify:FL=1